jgi:hypothetical protein
LAIQHSALPHISAEQRELLPVAAPVHRV